MGANFYIEIGQRLAKVRKEKGYTTQGDIIKLYDLAFPNSGISDITKTQYFSRFESGKNASGKGNIDVATLAALANVLNISIDSLIDKASDNQTQSKNIQAEKPLEEYTTKDICKAFIALSNIADIFCLNFSDISASGCIQEWIKTGAIDRESDCEPLIIALRPKVKCLWSLKPLPLDNIETENQLRATEGESLIGMLGDSRFCSVRNYLEYAFCETPYEDEHEISLSQPALNKILSAKLETLDIYPITPDIEKISASYPITDMKQKAIENFEIRRPFLPVCMTNFKIPEHDIDIYISVESLSNFQKKHES